MPVDNQTRKQNRLKQYNTILSKGFVADVPCEHCSSRGVDCVMDLKSRNCAECTRRGRKCTKRFHSDREWNSLEAQRQKLADELKTAEKRWLEFSQKMNKEMSTILRLRTQQEWLDKRNDRMQLHDAAVLEQLDDDNPLSAEDLAELDRLADASDAQILAATSEIPTLTQMLSSGTGAVGWSDAAFQSFFDPSGGDSLLPSGNTPLPAGGNPSSS